MNQKLLRYPSMSEQTVSRWRAVIESNRPLSDRVRQLLSIGVESLESVGPDGLQVGWRDQCLWIMCPQERLAEILDCSAKTIQRDLNKLKESDVLKKVTDSLQTETGFREVTAYVISLNRLEELPERAPCPELEFLMCQFPDPFGHHLETADSPLSGAMSGAMSGGLSSDMSAHEHEHEHEHEHDIKTHDHEHESFRDDSIFANSLQVRFGNIQTEHVRDIVGNENRELFLAYFADALSAGWAKNCEADQIRMAALFHQVIRNGKARKIGETIGGAWKKRGDSDPRKALKLSAEDEDFARRLLKPRPVPLNDLIRPLKKAQVPDDEQVDLSVSELQRQSIVRQSNIAALRSMERRMATSAN